METARVFLWAGEADSEEIVEHLTEWKYGDDVDDYHSWLEKSFNVSEYDQCFRSIGIRKGTESLREMILSMSYGDQYVDAAVNDINRLTSEGRLNETNVLFLAINIEYDGKTKHSETQGLSLTFVGDYDINW